jgi:multiple sugar transport system substrate-binding protein
MRKILLVVFLLSFFLLILFAGGAIPQEHPLAGSTVNLTILGISGWLPSTLAMEMAAPDANTSFSEFAEFARDNYGYTVNFSFAELPFETLFEQARDSLANRSNDYNIIIVDSQWLGALVELEGIVNITGLIEDGIPDMGIDPQPNLSLRLFSPAVRDAYQVYPDGTDQLWALPQEGDAIVLYVNKSLLESPKERAAFEAEYGFPMPAAFEDFENLTMPEFEKMARFFTRPALCLYGTAMQHSRTYDFQTMFLYPFMFSLGGDSWNPKTREVYGVLNSDVNALAMEWNKRMLDYEPPGAADFGIEESIDAYCGGRVFSAFQWAALGPSMLADPKVRENTLIVPPPGFVRSDGTFSRIYSIGGQPWVVNTYNNPEQMRVAVDFLNWWYLPEIQLEFARRGGNPIDARTVGDPSFESINPWNRAYKYMLQGNRSRDFWHEPSYAEMLAVQQEGFTAYLSGRTSDPMKVLNWIACRQQKILFDGGRSIIPPPGSCRNASLD